MTTPTRQLDRFAALLADSGWNEHDGDVGRIARRMGLQHGTGNGMLQRLRRDLGPQAR